MEKKFIMGIDVSKDKLDVCLVRTGSVEAAEEKVLKNSRTELEKYFKRTARKYGKEELLVCLEHTGYYGLLLCTVLQQSGIDYAVVPALEIKRAQGICRGKTDRVDAGRIAVYGWRYADRIRLTKLPGRELLLIKELSACRELYVKISVQLKNALKAHKDAGKAFENETVLSGISRQLKNIEEETAVCDEKIQKLVESIPGLNSNFHLLNTVSGIGPVYWQHRTLRLSKKPENSILMQGQPLSWKSRGKPAEAAV